MKENPHGGDVYSRRIRLDYSVNVNPLGPPPSVRQAVIDSLWELDRYPDYSARELKAAMSRKEAIPEEAILLGNGAAELILAICHAVRPKKACVTAPSFAEYETALRCVGAEVRYLPLYREDGFRLQGKALEQLTEDLDLLFLCNPNNPTGQMIDPEVLSEVLNRTREKNIRLVVDECFIEFVADGQERSLKKKLAEYPNLVILRAFTKTYAVPALRLGYAWCLDPEFVSLTEQHLPAWNLSQPAQKAGLAALSEVEYVEAAKQMIASEREILTEALCEAGFTVWPSVTNYIFFQADPDLDQRFLQEEILIRNCSNYPGLGPGYFRAAVKRPEENAEFIRILKNII